MRRLYSMTGTPAPRMPRPSRIDPGSALGLTLIALPWVLAAAIVLF